LRGDISEIPTDEDKLVLALVLGHCGRRLLACQMWDQPDAELAIDAIKMAAVVRGACSAIEG
jgi:putative transposase